MGSVSDRKPAQAATVGPAITAGTTQTQAGATVLVKDINEVTVSGTNGDGVQLPPASKGLRVTIINADAAQTIQVWPASGDDIDGGATNAVDSSAITSGDTRDYEAINSSSWYGVGAASTGDALTSNPLSQFASTTSAQLAGVISNETGSGVLVFATSPALVTPALGTPASGVMTNVSGTASSLTAGNVTTNANLTGHVTSTGNAAILGSFTIAQLNSAISDATAAILGANTFTGTQSFADNTGSRINLLDYGEVTNAIGGTGGSTQSIDLELGNSVSATVDTSANTFTFDNPTASDELCGFTLTLTNGGSQTVNWPASVDWAAATAPTLTAAGVDVLVFFTIDGGTIWNGFLAGADMSS